MCMSGALKVHVEGTLDMQIFPNSFIPFLETTFKPYCWKEGKEKYKISSRLLNLGMLA